MDTIGLIAAMPMESQALLKRVRGVSKIRTGALDAARFSIGSHDCVVVTSGMGMKRAEEAARWLIQELHPSSLISFGIAGAVQSDLKVGDVILAVRNSLLDGGSLTPALDLAEPSNQAWDAVLHALEDEHIRLVRGSAITTRGSQVASCPPEWEHPILEMETAGILKAAEASQTPLLVLRSISDGPNDPIPIDLGEAMDENSNLRMGALLGMVLRQPGLLLKSGAMMKNSRLAADHAARAVLTALQQERLF
jgi:nucleoside phosphorylase